jgi:hypothetical protein
MKRPARRRQFLLSLLVVALLQVLMPGLVEVSAASLNYAGVVVRHADGQMAYAYVGFAEEQINGVELLKRTGLDIVTVSFGGLGEGVCSIDEHGCPATDCRKRVCQGPREDDPFWQYFRQTSPGDWKPLALGGSQTKVHDGDVDGWSWTHTDPGLPPLSLEDVAHLAGYDGTTFSGAAVGEPGSAVRREGFAQAEDESQSVTTYIGAVALVFGALLFVGVFVVRRRRFRRVTS